MLTQGTFCLLGNPVAPTASTKHRGSYGCLALPWPQPSPLSINLLKTPSHPSPNCADCSPGNPEETKGDLQAAELMCTAKASPSSCPHTSNAGAFLHTPSRGT